jgi:hypothetical protein
MSIEDLKNTAHIRDLIVARLDPDVRMSYQRASQKAWRAAMKGEEILYVADEISAVELVERKLLDALQHRRSSRRVVTHVWR